MPRFLVFGGTGFAERARFGDWPAFPIGMLSDTYGIPDGGSSVGVGLKGEAPFLVYRDERHQIGRVYPFWLLLDPGRETWSRFEWNGGSLLLALQKTELWQALMQSPEGVDLQAVGEALDSLGPAQIAVGEPDNQLRGFFAAAATNEQVLRCSVTGNLESFPATSDLAEALASLPAAFRIGRGWLVGGSVAHCLELGCGAVIDPRATEELGAREIGSAGLLLASLEEINRSASTASLAEILSKPSSVWSREALGIIKAIGSLLGGRESEIAWQELSEAGLGGPLEYDLLNLSLNLPSEGKHFSAGRTTYLLEHLLRGDMALAPDASTWNPTTVSTHLRRSNVSIGHFLTSVRLNEDALLAIWRGELSDRASDPVRLIHSLSAQMEEQTVVALIGDFLSDDRASAHYQALWEQEWPAAVRASVDERLHEIAVHQVHERSPGWPRDYVLFGDDPLEPAFLSLVQPRDATSLVQAALDVVGPRARRRADNWLIKLAGSEVRRFVPLTLKRTVAARGFESWRDLAALVHLWTGAVDESAAGAERLPVLFEELDQLAVGFVDGAPAPNLEGLCRTLGRVWPKEVVDRLRHCKPGVFDDAGNARWIRGWQQIDAQHAGRERRRVDEADLVSALRGGLEVRLPTDDLLRRLAQPEITRWFQRYLDSPCEISTLSAGRRLSSLVSLAAVREVGRVCLDQLFRELEPPLADSLVRTLFERPGLLPDLTNVISDASAQRLFSKMVAQSAERFREIVITTMRSADAVSRDRRLVSCLKTYLAHDNSMARSVARSTHTPGRASFRSLIRELFGWGSQHD
jgi:hypothetical protein